MRLLRHILRFNEDTGHIFKFSYILLSWKRFQAGTYRIPHTNQMSSTACCHEFATILKYLCQISRGKSINFDKLRLMSQKMLLSGIGVSFKFSYTQCLKYGLFT